MGVDYVTQDLPNVKYTEERIQELQAIALRLTPTDRTGTAVPAAEFDAWRECIRNAVDELPALSERRDVGCTGDGQYITTGGESWGVDPTEAYTLMRKLNECTPLVDTLARYLQEDRIKGGWPLPTVMQLAATLPPGVLSLLAEYVESGDEAEGSVAKCLNMRAIADAEFASPELLAYARDIRTKLNRVIQLLDPTDRSPTSVSNAGTTAELHIFSQRSLSPLAIAGRDAAREEYANDDIEIDDCVMVSVGDGGVWVSAWVWVDDDQLQDLPVVAPVTVAVSAEVTVLLQNGKTIRSGWIDKDDPNALPAGDYLAVDANDGEQLVYMDSADLLADPAIGRRMLNDLLQACQ